MSETYSPNWRRVYRHFGGVAARLAIADRIRGKLTVENWILYGQLTNLLSVSNMQRGIVVPDLDERMRDRVTFEEIKRVIGRN